MGTELHSVLIYLAALREAEHLVAAAVGEDGFVPANELVKAAATRDQIVAGAQHQVVGITEDDARANLVKMLRRQGFHRALGADRHEHRRLDGAMRRLENTASRGTVGMRQREQKKGPDPLLSLSEEVAGWDRLRGQIRRTRSVSDLRRVDLQTHRSQEIRAGGDSDRER